MTVEVTTLRCPSCGQANRPGRRFCAQCGARFAPVCASCGEQNESGERFCGACGEPLGAGVARAEPAPVAPVSREEAVSPTSHGGGRYQVERFLGEGARKRVFLARDTRLSRQVAIAIVKTEGLDAQARARVRREAEAMGKLGDHPNVVTVFDVEEDAGQVLIVSRFVGGGDLAQRLRDAPDHRLPLRQALCIASDVARALAHAHERGVVHRDVKPGNIWLAEDGTALLGDFGLAAQSDRTRLTQEGSMLGTVAYMPPEQALGRAADGRSDLYSLGTTLYEMLAGRTPFQGEDAVAVIAQHINSQAVRPSWHEKRVPRELDELVMRMLAKSPDERPAGAGEVLASLEAIARALVDGDVHDSRSEEKLPPSTLGQFVGRERELQQLRDVFARVLSGAGATVMLVGEPGIGKTRLTKELSVHARLHGATVLSGPCYEGEGSVPYQPFVEALREHLRTRDDAALRAELGEGAPEIASLVPEIRARFPELGDPPRIDPEAERQRLFESMTAFVGRASRAVPLVLVLDDLHWSDKPTLLLLLHLSRRIRDQRVLLVGTYRDVELERTHPLADTVATLRREGLYERVLLRGLDRDGVRALLRARSGHEVPERFVERILQETEGNPFFVEEVVKHLAEIGVLRREGGEWVGDLSVVERSIPEGVREVIGHRLSRLSEPCNAMLTIASALSGGFTFEALAAICGESEDALLLRLEEALRAQLIRERDASTGGAYEFTHALIRQTLYHELSTPRRVRLHRQIAEALEALYGAESPAHLGELAFHYFQGAPGGDAEKAVATSVRAAEHALSLLAWEDAATHYARALEALEMVSDADDPRRFDLLFALGNAQRPAGERAAARATLTRAAEIARRLERPDLLARTALAYAAEDITVQIDRPDVVEILEEGLAAIGTSDLALRARLLSRLSIAIFFSRDQERKESLSSEAVELARRIGDPLILCRALIIQRIVTPFFATQARQRRESVREVAELSDRVGGSMRLNGRMSLLYEAMNDADAAALDREIETQGRLAAETREPAVLWFSALHRAVLMLMRGPLDEAERLIEAAHELGDRCEHPLSELFYGALQSRLESCRGTETKWAQRSLQYLASPIGRVISAGAPGAPVLLQLGRADEARVVFERSASQHFGDVPRDGNWLGRTVQLAMTAVRLGDRARAEELYGMLLPCSELFAVGGPFAILYGPTTQILAQLALLLGRADEAVTRFEDALGKLDRLRARVLAAPCRIELARALIARASDGDRALALARVTEALEAAEELGMAPTVEQALALKLELQGVDRANVRQSIYVVAEAVESRRPNLRTHAAPDGTVTLLFSDMQGFTEMTERLGDLRAREVIREHNRVVREQLAAHGGYEVELQGDGFLLAFGSARQGLRCAISIQRAFANGVAHASGEKIRVRIGVHTGEALKDADKFFGRTVILAARIAAQANGGEILASTLVRDLTSSTGDLRFGAEREVALKGISATQRVVPVEWAEPAGARR